MEHILFFPEPYPDEDFRSMVYRYHVRSGNVELNTTRKELFDLKSYKLGLFPRNLSYFLNQIPDAYHVTIEEILSHTWFPLFRPFFSKERISQVYDDIMNRTSNSSNYVSRVATQRNIPVLSKEIKYCPLCMKEDYKNYGESFVHLKHQLAFIDFCPKHQIILIDKCPQCGKYFSNQNNGVLKTKTCCNNIKYETVENSRITEFKIRFLNELNYLKEYGSTISSDDLYMKMIIHLGNNGYILIKGSIDRKRLLADVFKKYQDDCPDLIKAIKETLYTKGNIQYFLNQEKMTKFLIIYVLLIIFLAGSVEEFLNSKESYSIPLPFGAGPWPCHNDLCPSHLIVMPITKCERIYIRNGFKGRFICPVCGFEYEQKWIQGETESISNNKYIVKKRGYLWNEKVIELHNSRYKVDEIATILRSYKSNVQSVLKNYKKLTANTNIMVTTTKIDNAAEAILLGQSEVAATKTTIDEVRRNYRAKIKDLKKIRKNLNRTVAFRLAQKECKWLLRNDYEWLNHVLPTFSLDYLRMDINLQEKVRNVAKILYASNPPNRIRMYTILNRLDSKDKNFILSHKDKLPKTIAEVDLHIETIDDYQVRHVPVLVSQFKSIGRKEKVSLDSIITVRKSYQHCSEETKKRIEEVLEKLQND